MVTTDQIIFRLREEKGKKGLRTGLRNTRQIACSDLPRVGHMRRLPATTSDRGFGVTPRPPHELQDAPHLLVVGVRNSLDLDSARRRQEAKRGARQRLRRDREIIPQPPSQVFFNTNPKRPSKEHGGAALQGKDLRRVPAARLQGAVPPRRSLPEYRGMWIAYGVYGMRAA